MGSWSAAYCYRMSPPVAVVMAHLVRQLRRGKLAVELFFDAVRAADRADVDDALDVRSIGGDDEHYEALRICMLLGSVDDLRRERRKTLRPGNGGFLECLAAVDRD